MPTTPLAAGVNQFRARRPGPEVLIQDVVAGQIPQLFAPGDHSWTAASLPLGAGIPDLVIVSYHPQLMAIANVDLTGPQILAYLRAVGRAKLETIAERTGTSQKKLSRSLSHLVEADAVLTDSESYTLSPLWREILPEIITVEVKVANWQKAISQAARNRIFAHRSFVALPCKTAERVQTEPLFRTLGIGLLSVAEDETVNVLQQPRRHKPSVWTYYYRLASFVARSGRNDGRLKMAESLREQHPDVTKVTRKWGRWQHHVDYSPFNKNRFIPKPGFVEPTEANNYGMVLEILDQVAVDAEN